jgi:hypothetical protein
MVSPPAPGLMTVLSAIRSAYVAEKDSAPAAIVIDAAVTDDVSAAPIA